MAWRIWAASKPPGRARGNDPRAGLASGVAWWCSGLLLRTRAALGDRGSPVRLRFELPLHDIDTRLELDASIRNVREEAVEEGTEFQYGLDFHELTPNDRMMVKSFVYQTIIEYPRRII